MKRKLLLLHLLSFLIGFGGYHIGLSFQQSVIVSIFSVSILGTLFFWEFRLSFAFIGCGVFFLIKAINLESFIRYASVDVILFLIAMMIIVGMMKEGGFFEWLITLLLRVKQITGLKLFIILMVSSAVFSAVMGEVTSIIIMVNVIIELCSLLNVSPIPLIISSILATNIGSAATVLGNPVGVLIAARAGLSFEDFLIHAFPASMLALAIVILILVFWYKKYLQELSEQLKIYSSNKGFLQLISIPPDKRTRMSMLIFGITIFLIAFHKRWEILLGLEANTLLIIIPVISAGIVMLYRHDKARHYVEKEVEWNSLLFFMFLFAQAGVLQATGIASFLAQKIVSLVGKEFELLAGMVLLSSGVLSSILDNVVTVTAFVPVIQGLDVLDFHPDILWWPLLFGACFGGNITVVGSTANIIALDIMEKQLNVKINFISWLKIGGVVGAVSMLVGYTMILLFCSRLI